MMTEEERKRAYEKGFKFEEAYGGCAQCAIGALYELYPDLQNGDIFRSGTGLGAGIGLTTKGACGALAGAVMVISQMTGRSLENIADPEKKRFIAYRFAERLVNKFIEKYGTVTCEEIQKQLMGRSFSMYTEWDDFIAAGGHSTACTTVVGKATEWAAEIIEEIKNH
jgi:C_GCAxxG_C_C family probable redox protein